MDQKTSTNPTDQPASHPPTCESTIAFGDDFGDNESTFHCELPPGHEGLHQESGDMYGQPFTLTWKGDPQDVDLDLPVGEAIAGADQTSSKG